jgi:ABC-2 type transport system permease protein
MNWAHFKAFVWLRWRLMVNQWRRAGTINAVLTMIVVVSALIMAIPLFFGCLALAIYLVPKAEPVYLMYVWDGLIFFFLLFWGIGLLVELQKNDPLSLSKFMHLPVSVNSAFLINYVSSLVRLSLVFFGPMMLAFALALIYVKGVEQLAALPALAAFLLMITAPTYQFQGWLASLMSNPRRRRTIVVGLTMGFVLVFQVPNLVNFYFTPRFAKEQASRSQALAAETAKIQQARGAKEIDEPEALRRENEVIARYKAEGERSDREQMARWQGIVRIINSVVPLGWLPVGVMYSAEGQVLPGLLGLAGMTLIGSTSLWMAYLSAIAQFQGQSSNRKVRAAAPEVRREEGDRRPRGQLLEIRLPGLSEQVSAVALGGFRSLLRSPEAKITLLTPLIMGGVFGSILLQGRQSMPMMVRPLFGIGAISFVLFGLLQLMGNQFGMDRDGFRLFVLCPIPRRDILLGKNLACVPPAFVLSAVLVIAILIICPMRFDHALSMIPQFVSMYLLFCSMANLFSIYAPVFIAAGTLKAANPKMSTILLQLLMFMILFPICQGLTLIPLGAEAILNAYGLAQGVPVCLLLSLALCAAVLVFYYFSLGWLGSCLQAREQKILETVTNRGA